MQRHIPANDTRSNTKADATENNPGNHSYTLANRADTKDTAAYAAPTSSVTCTKNRPQRGAQSDGAYFFSSPGHNIGKSISQRAARNLSISNTVN
ncbi:Uncharacterised protein [Klebsiella quasipneumoniae]|nr:Uncharacterised protein [Klebsiella quasipneumoniae]